jgi:hypothetical protein
MMRGECFSLAVNVGRHCTSAHFRIVLKQSLLVSFGSTGHQEEFSWENLAACSSQKEKLLKTR